jgi:hypothetical protein
MELVYDCIELRPGVPEPYPVKLVDHDGQVVHQMTPNDALEMAKNLLELVDSHHHIVPVPNNGAGR